MITTGSATGAKYQEGHGRKPVTWVSVRDAETFCHYHDNLWIYWWTKWTIRQWHYGMFWCQQRPGSPRPRSDPQHSHGSTSSQRAAGRGSGRSRQTHSRTWGRALSRQTWWWGRGAPGPASLGSPRPWTASGARRWDTRGRRRRSGTRWGSP